MTELLGRRVGRSATQPRLLRIDLTLHATLPHGSTTPTPAPDIWAPWVASVEEKLEKMLPAVSGGRKAMVMGWRGDVEIGARFTPDATFSLLGISVSAFQFVQIPRIWDNPKRREKEKGPNKQLDQLARRFRSALDVWMASIGELGRWIRYTPGPPGRPSPRGGAGPFRDDGPETTH